MNKISLSGTVWIASDIHLAPHLPATQQAFHTFLDNACARADALILCGDIFDAWIGDDLALHSPPDWLDATLQKLKHVAQTIPLWIGRGNRDFLIGLPLTKHLGAQLLPETTYLETDYGALLLSHGDQYCTSDASYQRFRRFVRNPWVEKAFLTLSLSCRRQIANFARKRSLASNRYKASSIMDVDTQAIEHAFKTTGVTTLVHGHTHRPAIHHIQIHSVPCTRIVLPDWDCDHGQPIRGGWLTIDRQGFRLNDLSEIQPRKNDQT